MLNKTRQIKNQQQQKNIVQVSFEVSAQDDVDGPVAVNCDHNSGDTFPIGDTEVQCSATDAAGNTGTESFTVTVNPPDEGTTPPANDTDT